MGIQSVLGAFVPNGAPGLEVHIVLARVPRTVFGVLAGAALGMSGLLMQSITRNPIADPSILGVNTGASLFVVCGIAFFHIQSGNQYIWLAFAGAALTAVLVYGLASVGTGGATPIRLALAGAAASTALQSLVNTVMLPNTQVMDQFRFWQVGSISGASWEDIKLMSPYLAVGFVLAFFLVPSLNTLALGDDESGEGISGTLRCPVVCSSDCVGGTNQFHWPYGSTPDTRTCRSRSEKDNAAICSLWVLCFTDFRCPWKNMGKTR